MELVPIKELLEENGAFVENPLCQDSIYMAIDFYKKVGYNPPWISYYVKIENELVGAAAFKGKPVNGKIEIAYGTFGKYRNQGNGTSICRQLVNLSLKTDPSVTITARTLPEENFSTKLLRKNDFVFGGTVIDPEDGEVWEWIFKGYK